MTQEEKDLLFRDLCARLPYGVVYQVARPAFPSNELRVSNEKLRRIEVTIDGDYGVGCNSATLTSITKIKPYLRPLSSMTREEREDFIAVGMWHDWLNAHHFDHRGLIEQGLAISTEVFNPYKD